MPVAQSPDLWFVSEEYMQIMNYAFERVGRDEEDMTSQNFYCKNVKMGFGKLMNSYAAIGKSILLLGPLEHEVRWIIFQKCGTNFYSTMPF